MSGLIVENLKNIMKSSSSARETHLKLLCFFNFFFVYFLNGNFVSLAFWHKKFPLIFPSMNYLNNQISISNYFIRANYAQNWLIRANEMTLNFFEPKWEGRGRIPPPLLSLRTKNTHSLLSRNKRNKYVQNTYQKW